MFLVLFLCHWSLIGLSKTYFFNIPEDFLLAQCNDPALYLFFRGYFLNNLHADTKPKAKYINWLLVFCVRIYRNFTYHHPVSGVDAEQAAAALLPVKMHLAEKYPYLCRIKPTIMECRMFSISDSGSFFGQWKDNGQSWIDGSVD